MQHAQPKPRLYLLLGVPGAGKTTAAKVLAELTGATRLSSDEVRLKMFPKPSFSQAEHNQLYEALNTQADELLRQGKSVIYDANLNRRQHRLEKYAIGRKAGAEVRLLWVQVPEGLAKQRATDPSRHPLIPPNETAGQMFDRIAGVIEPPQADELAIKVDGSNVSAQSLKAVVDL